MTNDEYPVSTHVNDEVVHVLHNDATVAVGGVLLAQRRLARSQDLRRRLRPGVLLLVVADQVACMTRENTHSLNVNRSD